MKVATVEGVRIEFYPNDHPPPRFHAVTAEYRAVININPISLDRGELPRAKRRVILAWAQTHQTALQVFVVCDAGETEAAEDPMRKKLPRIETVKPVMYGVLKLTFDDGYKGVVDLRPFLANEEIFAFLRAKPERFMKVKREKYGHSVYWIDEEGDVVDLGADGLRRDAEKQAALIALAS